MYLPSIPKLSSLLLWFMWLIMFPLSLALIYSNKTLLFEWDFLHPLSSTVYMTLILDPAGTLFSSVVLFISANVLFFTNSYMAGDPFIARFVHLVLLFVLSMNMLIFIPNLIMILLGWDGLGLVSFLLVIYYQNPKSLAAGMITALTNRIGDVLILLSIGWSLTQGHWNIIHMWNSEFSHIMVMSLMVAAMTKSAQMPFSSWLPAAMAAPTPVSALVHSSTLVTAGVFLVYRFYPFLHLMKWFNPLLLLIASFTMLMAGMSAMTECDMKKIVALSTLSQLGVMMASLGLNLPTLALFHLMTHALFKALLFLCVGSFIHLHSHSQDLRTMGNISDQMPLTASCLVIANLALSGTPFLAGFYSKDMILEFTLFNPSNIVILAMFFFATGLTSAYSMRMMFVGVWTMNSSTPIHNVSNADKDLFIPCTFLSLGAIMGGSAMNWLIFYPMEEAFLPPYLKFLTIFVTLLGASVVLINFYRPTPSLSFLSFTPMVHSALYHMWFLVPLSSQGIIKSPLTLAHYFTKVLDQGWTENLTGQGAYMTVKNFSQKIQPLQNNIITYHLLLSFIALFVFTSM